MSAANLIYESQRRRAQERSRRDWEERTRNDPTNPANRYRMHLEDFRINQMKDAENKRALALQEKSNQGLLGVEDRRQIGSTKRTGLEQAGMTGRLGMTQAGLNLRDKISNALERRRLAGQQFKMLQELDASNLGLEKPINYGQRFRDFNTEMLGGQGQGQNQRQYDTLDRAKGMREYYDRDTGKLVYTDLTDPDSRPTKTGLKYLSQQDPMTREAEGMRQISVAGMGDGTMPSRSNQNVSFSDTRFGLPFKTAQEFKNQVPGALQNKKNQLGNVFNRVLNWGLSEYR